MNREQMGQAAFNAYGDAVGWRTHSGAEMPTWTQVGERIREAWSRAAEVVASKAGHSPRNDAPIPGFNVATLPPGFPPEQKPTIGRIVHFMPHDATLQSRTNRRTFPAIVTEVHGEGLCSLAVFTPEGSLTARAPQAKEPEAPGCWWWPPRAG